MSVRLRTFLLIIGIAVCLLIGMFVSSYTILMGSIKKQEVQLAYSNVKRVLKVIDRDIKTLDTVCGDWAAWDDTYKFIIDHNKKYLHSNLDNNAFSILKINLLLYIDLEGNIQYGRMYDLINSKSMELSSDIKDYIFKENTLLQHSKQDSSITGIAVIGDIPMMIASRPITTTDMQGEIKGTLIMGKWIGDQEEKGITDMIHTRVAIEPFRKEKLTGAIEYSASHWLAQKIFTKVLDQNRIKGYTVIKDVYGNDAAIIEIVMERDIYQQGYNSFRFFMIIICVTIIIIMLTAILISQGAFISRIEYLSSFMDEIRRSKNMSLRAKVTWNDEISNLAYATNYMLEEIDAAYQKIRENEERLTIILEGTNDGIWDYNIAQGKIYISRQMAIILGYGTDECFIEENVIYDLFGEEEYKKIEKAYMEVLEEPNKLIHIELKIYGKENLEKWILVKGKVAERNKNGQPLRMAGMGVDITEPKRYQQEIEYLSFHDTLTDLYNRSYFKKEISRLEEEGELPLSIIIGDVNGLKFANDAFSHFYGDELLVKIADVLKKACREGDIIARTGGDEFSIVLPNTTEQEANEICDRIKALCETFDKDPIRPSIALGVVMKKHKNENIRKLIEIAEDRMYKNKLLENTSPRHSDLALMERALLETDFETREHTDRLYELSRRMGKFMNLSNSQMDELSLLSKLHDIGKTAIPREILTKPGKLSAEEWENVKKHTEIGYRIAKSSHHLAPIAELILSHHEKWDGSGYPRGLKGEEIPLLSRIIALVDAYDVITNARPYKKAASHEEAITEMVRCAGTHFDPRLVEVFIQLNNKENI